MSDPQTWTLLGIVGAFAAATLGAVHNLIGARLEAVESRLAARLERLEGRMDGLDGRIDRLHRDVQAIAERVFRDDRG